MRIALFVALWLASLGVCAQGKEVIVRISQDESYVLDKYYTEITLEKKSFRIQVLLNGVDGIYSFAGFSDSICCRVEEMDTIHHLHTFPEITMAEPNFNKDKELLVGEKDCSYWYFDPELNTHRFNKKVVKLDSSRYVGIKTVKQVYYVPKRKEIKIKDLRTPLYLFFVAVDETDNEGRPIKELMRRKLKINWIDED